MTKINLSKTVEKALADSDIKKKSYITSLQLLQSIDSKSDSIQGSEKTLEKENKNQLVPYPFEYWHEEISRLFNKNEVNELDDDLVAFGVFLIDQNLGREYYKNGFLYELVSKEKLSSISKLLTEKGSELWEKIKTSPLYNYGRTQDDRPTEIDRLGRRPFAKFLVDIIYDLQEQQAQYPTKKGDSIFLHIDGPWGSGKSTLLKLMRMEFRAKNWIVVEFNAWQTHGLDHPWWQLMDAVYKEIVVRQKWKEYKISVWQRFGIFFLEHLWRLSVNRRSLYFLILAGLLMFIGALFIYTSLSQPGGSDVSHIQANITQAASNLSQIQATTSQSNSSNDSLGRIIIALGGTGAGIITIIGGFLSIMGTVINTVSSESTAKRFKESTSDPMSKISDHFNKLIHRIVEAAKPKAKSTPAVVILVDDLDRCNEGYVVTFLQEIQTLFRNAALSCIVAADRRWLYKSFESAYKNFSYAIAETGYPFGKLFLDKIFQFSVSMPIISHEVQERYWTYLLNEEYDKKENRNKSDDKMSQIDNIPDMIQEINKNKDDPLYNQELREAAVKRLSSKVIVQPTESLLNPFYKVLEPPNPRSMKKFINEYRIEIARHILSGREIKNDVDSLLKFALWVFINYRWPYLAEYLESNPKMVKYIGKCDDRILNIVGIPKALHKSFHDQLVDSIINGRELQISLDEQSIIENALF